MTIIIYTNTDEMQHQISSKLKTKLTVAWLTRFTLNNTTQPSANKIIVVIYNIKYVAYINH